MVCAWCNTLIAPNRGRAGFEHNYGMCRGCVEEQLARLETKTARDDCYLPASGATTASAKVSRASVFAPCTTT